MTTTVYLTGYSGKSPDDILEILTEINGNLFDVRFSPRSRNPEWSKKRLTEFFGDRYAHVNALGNKNYKGGDIEIVNYEAGKQMILDSDRPVLLLCMCARAGWCHRTTVGDLLRVDGFTVYEWGDQPVEDLGPGQLNLFEQGDT